MKVLTTLVTHFHLSDLLEIKSINSQFLELNLSPYKYRDLNKHFQRVKCCSSQVNDLLSRQKDFFSIWKRKRCGSQISTLTILKKRGIIPKLAAITVKPARESARSIGQQRHAGIEHELFYSRIGAGVNGHTATPTNRATTSCL